MRRSRPGLAVPVIVGVVALAACAAVVVVGSFGRSSAPRLGHASVLFSVPVGMDGIGVDQPPDQPPRGPEAIAVHDDGAVWIADTVQHRLVAYDAEGILLARFDLMGHATSIADIAVHDDEIAVLDTYPMPATVLLLDRGSGSVRERMQLPETLSLAAGLSGITYGPDGELRAELAGGERTARLADAGLGAEAITPGWPTRHGTIVIEHDRPAGQLGHRAAVNYGRASFEIVLDAYLFVGPIGTDEGGVFLLIEELSQDLGGRVEVNQTVERRGLDGELLAHWPVSALPEVHVAHPFAIEPDGSLLWLVPGMDHIEVIRVTFGD